MKMKTHFDRKSVYRRFQEGGLVLVILSLPTSTLEAKFSGPYTIKQKLSDTDYALIHLTGNVRPECVILICYRPM